MNDKPSIEIDADTARRFILGRQGLWPGRRWAGKEGVAAALRQAELVQIDPLNVVARSHDLALHSRVLDYDPAHLDALLYRDRAFFDYGEALFIMPLDERPYWQTIMQRRAAAPRWVAFAESHAALLDEMRQALAERGPLGSRDVATGNRVTSYRASHDAGLALYYLWLTGELMTHHRNRFDRVYDFSRNILPAQTDGAVSPEEAEHFLVRKQIAFLGLCRPRWFGGLLSRKVSPDEATARVRRLLAGGEIAAVSVAGEAEPSYMLTSDLPLLDMLARGQVPDAWRPLAATTLDEVLFLAPLEIVSARRRAKALFGFDYVWEVYKPAGQRRWGYYTLPILWGDRLVARFDPKLDRKTDTLVVKGSWLEKPEIGRDVCFAEALGRGLARLAHMAGARQVDVVAIEPAGLRQFLGAHVPRWLEVFAAS